MRLPRISNFTDIDALASEPGVLVRYADRPAELADADLVVLPGTRATVADLAWLRERGLADMILRRARRGQPVLGICGGYQMLAGEIHDDVESGAGLVPGLGLLPVRVAFGAEKKLGRLAGMAGGVPVTGYEIHHGVATVQVGTAAGDAVPGDALRGGAVPGDALPGDALRGDALPGDALLGGAVPGDALRGGAVPGDALRGDAVPGDALRGGGVEEFTDGCRVGAVWGTSWHGLLENDEFRRIFLADVARIADRDFTAAPDTVFAAVREARLDALGDLVTEHLDTSAIRRLIESGPPAGLPMIRGSLGAAPEG